MPTSQFKTPTALNSFTNSVTPPSPTSAFSSNTSNTSSTPSSTAIQSSPFAQMGGVFGSLAAGYGGVPYGNATKSAVTPTATGGTTFDPSIATAYNKPAQNTNSNANYTNTSGAGTPASSASGLAQYTHTNTQTPNGGTVSINGNGTPSGYSPNGGFTIGTSGATSSNALNGQNTASGLQNSYQTYQDLVNGVSQAQGYSPAYQQALAQQYGTQNQASYLGTVPYTGGTPGQTGVGQNGSVGTTGLVGSQATTLTGAEQALNAQQQTAANINLNTQQLARTGAISAAQTQLQYSPQGQAGSNAITQYNSLQQAYPGANIPEYNQSLTPEQNQQVASYIVANSPAYKAQFQSQYSTAGGGTGIYNKLDTGGLTQNADGTISLVNDGAAITGAADKASANTLTSQINSLTPAYNAANQDFTYLTNFMQSAGINQSNIPAINQVQQAIQAKALDPGALAEFKAGIASLRTNYAALLGSRGETPTQAGSDAQSLVPDTLSPAQLTQVQNALNVNGKNIIDANHNQLQNILSKYGGQAGSTGLNAGSTSTGSGWGSLGD